MKALWPTSRNRGDGELFGVSMAAEPISHVDSHEKARGLTRRYNILMGHMKAEGLI